MSRSGTGATDLGIIVDAVTLEGGGPGPDGAVVTSVAASTSSVTLLAVSANRMGATFQNDSTATAYLKLGTAATSTSFTSTLAPGGYFQLDYPVYTGIITCAWSAATGNMRITELTGAFIIPTVPTITSSNVTAFQGTSPWLTLETSGLVPKVFDYISLTYTGVDLTGVVYKIGGVGGTVVATLTMTYLLNVLMTVTRT